MNVIIALSLSFLAGISTILGGLLYSQFKTLNSRYFSYFLGLSAGAMIAISLFDLLPTAITGVGIHLSIGLVLLGALIGKVVDFAIPHHITVPFTCTASVKKMMTTGIAVSVGMIIHNIPEGMAVFMASLHQFKFGMVIALATAIHNIPEGLAIAAPIMCATNNKRAALRYTVIAGLAEPFGALVTYALLQPFLSDTVLAGLFAVVAGIMLFISFDELIPWCFKDGHHTQAVAGITSGMLVLAMSVFALQ
jgi:ZIP family zinc transporter